MKYSKYEIPAAIKSSSTEKLLDLWEITANLKNAEAPIVRGWLMDEIESRNPGGFDAWLDLDEPEDKYLRKYILCAEVVK